MPENNSLQRLQELLRDLFQFDFADLDFGIYRLLRLKRGEVEAFLTEQLPRRVDEVFKGAAGDVHAQLERELAGLAERVRQEIDADALSPTGEIKEEYRQQKAKAVRELIAAYDAKRKQVQEIQVSEEQKAEVFNHLWAFFSRYYEAGDFIPKRRYGARKTYAVPYNGEEVFFHWANRDQHYVKTAEALRDYAFTVDMLGKPCRVRFTLNEASLPPGNTKGDTRYFFPLPKEAAWDKDTRTFTLPFHYRPPTESEIEKHGKNSKLQESVLQSALPKIVEAATDAGLKARLVEIVDKKEDEETSLLLKRLRHFCRKNTSDYFIHKDLDGFLRRELEFYLKDQVLHLADLEGDLPAKQRTLHVIRQLAEGVIQFLAQIENVQRRLFEKRKFVLKTDYLAPIQNVPRELWKEIIANDKQLAAWKDLFAVEPKKVNEKFLAEHPTLVVNTWHFDAAFKERVLAAFDDLDEVTDGLLIHAENYQALRFLESRYAGKIKCTYIDPPYNTDASPIIYKNGYKSSTWAALIQERVHAAKPLLSSDGVLVTAIDDEQQRELNFVLSEVFNGRILGTICVRSNPSGRPTKTGYAVSHEYLIFAGQSQESGIGRLPATEEQAARFSEEDEEGSFEWRNLRREGSNSDRSARRALYYPIYLSGQTIRVPKMTWNETKEEWIVHETPRSGEKVVWPDNEAGEQKTWRWEWKTVVESLDELSVRPDRSGKDYVYYKRRPHEEGVVSVSSWFDAKYSATEHGTALMKDLFGKSPFSYPKSLYAVVDAIFISGAAKPTASVFDFFGGSGTTGHAVIHLNRQYGGHRKFILVEMADYFYTVLLPRIQKIMFTAEWSEGKPTRMANKAEAKRTPRLVKVLLLEGYEDALHNLVSDETTELEAPRAKAIKGKVGGDAYRLRYMARLPLEASASMLNLAKLEHPFT